MKITRLFKQSILALLLLFFATQSYAMTECNHSITSIYTGDGLIFFVFDTGGQAYMPAGTTDSKNIYALALTALISNKRVQVRFAADNVVCTADATHNDITGMWIVK